MSLTNIKSKIQSERGFTIVELLIVVVVIAILAAITIVSYNGITRSANASASKQQASTVAKKVESYQAEQGRYPINTGELNDQTKSYNLTSGFLSGTVGSGTTFLQTGLDANNGKTTVIIRKCATTAVANQGLVTAANINGVQILIWDYEGTPVTTGTVQVSLGTTTNCPATQGTVTP